MTKTTLTVKRPNGQVETVDISAKHPSGINDVLFAKMQAATREAGRGEVLSYDVEVIDDRSAAEQALDAVHRLRDRAELAADHGQHAAAIRLGAEADAAEAQWAADYPAEAAARNAAEAERRDEIARGPIARAMAEGRD